MDSEERQSSQDSEKSAEIDILLQNYVAWFDGLEDTSAAIELQTRIHEKMELNGDEHEDG